MRDTSGPGDQTVEPSGDARSYDDQRTDWRTDRHGGAKIIDRVKDRWNRGVAEPPATAGPSEADRGPARWRRSDHRIQDDVAEELARHPDVDASGIEVAVANAEVTLSGTVADGFEMRAAEDCAWNVRGVKTVHALLRVAARR